MKKYKNKEMNEILCNRCGKKILVERGIVKEGVYFAEMKWGYFSRKDGELHSFELCEECYDEMIESFLLPIEKKNIREYL